MASSPPCRWAAPLASIISPSGGSAGDHGRVAPQRPERQTLEGGLVVLGIGIVDQQARDERLGLGGRHAGTKPEGARGGIRRR